MPTILHTDQSHNPDKGEESRAGAMWPRLPAVGRAALIALPGGLTLYLAFDAGGFFAGTTATAALAVAVALVLRITTSERPSEGFGLITAIAAGALGMLAAWTLTSALWSDAPARALIEYDRVLLYWLALVVGGCVPWRRDQVDWAVRVLALVFAVVCLAGLVSRVLPEVLTTSPGVENDRLSYPLTYWNAMGLMAGLGLILGFHLASARNEPLPVRVLATAALPLLAATLYFTFSRGAIGTTVIGLAAYVILVRSWTLIPAALAAVPATAVAVYAAYDADLLSTDRATTAAAVAQGESLVPVLLLCALTAGAARALLLGLDRRLASVRLTGRRGRRVRIGAALAAGVVLIVAFAAMDVRGEAERQYERFVDSSETPTSSDLRARLTDPGNNGRLEQWDIALEAAEPVLARGTGAGTFSITWARERREPFQVEDGHSLYVETLTELGLVGLLLVITAVLTLLVGVLTAFRRNRSPVYAAVGAAGLGWAVHAGIDWDWEMPAITLWFFALGGMCLARPSPSEGRKPLSSIARVALGVGVLVLAVTPALIATSQARLDDAVTAFRERDCAAAVDAGLSSIDALSVRPEPFLVLGFCDVRLGEERLAVQAMRRAVSLDPGGWRTHYGLALALASAGQDPRGAARRSNDLNPLSPLTQQAVKRFDTEDPRKWKRRARKARLFGALSGG